MTTKNILIFGGVGLAAMVAYKLYLNKKAAELEAAELESIRKQKEKAAKERAEKEINEEVQTLLDLQELKSANRIERMNSANQALDLFKEIAQQNRVVNQSGLDLLQEMPMTGVGIQNNDLNLLFNNPDIRMA